MKVYVATRFDRWEHAKKAHEKLRKAGHVPTSEWVFIADQINGVCEAVDDPDERRSNALRNLEDISRSDALLLLVPHVGGTGMWFELGYAYYEGIPVYCVGPAKTRSIFTELPGVRHHDSLDSAISALNRLPRSPRDNEQ